MSAIFDRLGQHIADERAGKFAGRDINSLPEAISQNPFARIGLGILSAMGAGLEADTNLARAGTGALLTANAKFNPIIRFTDWGPDSGPLSGRAISRQAAQGFDQSGGNLVQRLMAANEAGARGNERLTGLLNLETDPMNLLAFAGPAAELPGWAGRIGRGASLLDKAQAIPFKPIEMALQSAPGLAARTGVERALAATLGRATMPAREALGNAVGQFLTDPEAQARVASQLRNRGGGAVVGGLTGGANSALYQSAQGDDPFSRDTLIATLAGAGLGGALGSERMGQGLDEMLRLDGRPGFFERRALARTLEGHADDVINMGGGVGPGRAEQLAQVARRRKVVVPPPTETLEGLVGPDNAQELLRYFPADAEKPMTPDELVRIIQHGRVNLPANAYAQFVAQHWDRARAGQLSAHDIISSYLPAILSQQRGAMTPEGILDSARALAVDPLAQGLEGPPAIRNLGQKYPELAARIQRGLSIGGTDANKFRPEDLAAWMIQNTDEGRDLGSALRYGDPQAIASAVQNFNAIWPHTGLSDPQELQALVQAGQDNVFDSLAQMMNRMATSGQSGDDIAQVLRDWATGGGSTDVPFRDESPLLGPGKPKFSRKTGETTYGVAAKGAPAPLDNRLASKNNWGAIIDRIANGKAGFLTQNLGGPSATFDTRVADRMGSMGTPENYTRALQLMFPGDDPGLGHHKFWDAQAFDPLTGTSSQSPHLELADMTTALQRGFRYPSPFNAGVDPGMVGRSLGPLAERARQRTRDLNLRAFMEGAHPLLLNEDGSPKVFYHGTRAGNFDQFDMPDKPGDFGTGVYFTERPQYASIYASGVERDFTGSDNFRPTSAGGNVKPTYVNLKNPYVWGENPQLDAALRQLPPEEITPQLQRAGYDGVIVTDQAYIGGSGYRGNPNQIEEMVAFDPATQVKSATGNAGTFDRTNPSLLHAGLSVDDITNSLDAIRQRFAPAVSRTGGRFPALAEGRPQVSAEERRYIEALQRHLDDRADDDMARLENHAYTAWNAGLGKAAQRDGFLKLWQALIENIENMRVLETGLGDAATVNRIVNSGQGLVNGFELAQLPDMGGTEGLIRRKANAIATPGRARLLIKDILTDLGVDTGDQSLDDWITSAYNAETEILRAQGAKIDKGFKLSTPQQVSAISRALGAQPEHLQGQFDEMARERALTFLTNEGRAKELLGLGNPMENLQGRGRKANRYVYTSVTEGEAAGQKQSGTIRIAWKPDTPRVTSLTHDYMLAAPDVEDIHATSTPKAVQALWGDRSVPPDREALQQIGDTGETITGSPLVVGPRAEAAARAAMIIMSAPKQLLREAQEGNFDAALGLMLRGGQDQQSAGTMKLLGIQRAPTRTETLVLDPDLRNAQAVIIHGGSEKVIQENLAAASKLLDQAGVDIPIYVMRGPKGSPPNILPEDISPGRGAFVQRYAGQRPLFAGKPEDRLSGLEDFGAGLTPGAVGRAAAAAGKPALYGAGIGAAYGATQDDESRLRGAAKGAVAGAIGGTALGHLAPELGAAVAKGWRAAAPGMLEDTIVGPKALGLANEVALKAQEEGEKVQGATLANLPRAIDDFWRARVVETFRGLALDALTLRGLVADYGKDYGVRAADVAGTQADLIDNFRDPDPLRRLGNLGNTIEDWGLEGFVDEETGLDQVIGTGFGANELSRPNRTLLSTPQRMVAGAGLSLLNLRDWVLPGVSPAISAVMGKYAPYIDAAYKTLNGIQHAAPRITFWDASLRRDLPVAAAEWMDQVATKTGIDFTPLQAKLAAGQPVRDTEVGQFLTKNYNKPSSFRAAFGKGLSVGEINELESNYREALGTQAMENADGIAKIFGDFRDKNTTPWKTFLSRVFPFSRFAIEYAPTLARSAARHPYLTAGAAAGLGASAAATVANGEPFWNSGTVPISTETPGLGLVARARLGGQRGTVRIDPLKQFTGPVSASGLAGLADMEGKSPYDMAVQGLGVAGLQPHPGIGMLASLLGQSDQPVQPMDRYTNITNAADLVPGMPHVPSLAGPFAQAKEKLTGMPQDEFDRVARRYGELVTAQTGQNLDAAGNRQALTDLGNPDDPLWRRARQEVRLNDLIGGLLSVASPIQSSTQTAENAAYREARNNAPPVLDPQAFRDAGGTEAQWEEYWRQRRTYPQQHPEIGQYRDTGTQAREYALTTGGPYIQDPYLRAKIRAEVAQIVKRKDR